MQLLVTLLLVAGACGFTLFSAVRTFFPAQSATGCSHGCGACPVAKTATKKGEPAELIPLQGLIGH